jgi:hypothetical protein
MCRASYRAGLAAGGDDIDWRAWLRERVQDWSPVPIREKVLRELDDPNYGAELVYLPPYWRQSP